MPMACTVPALLRRRSTIGRLALAAALLSTVFSDTQTTGDGRDCLNLIPQEKAFFLKDHRDKCFRDERSFSKVKDLQDAEKLLGISASEITFIGCDIAPFSTRIDRTEPQLHFEILYDSTLDSSAAVIAMLHELGHVYQLKDAGSREDLLSSAQKDLKRVELGADYLCGLAVGRLHLSEKHFEVALALVGSYEAHSAPHGSPHERSAAFNYGITAGKNTDTSVSPLYGKFQDDDYGYIKQVR